MEAIWFILLGVVAGQVPWVLFWRWAMKHNGDFSRWKSELEAIELWLKTKAEQGE